jgi:hypothetical protein
MIVNRLNDIKNEVDEILSAGKLDAVENTESNYYITEVMNNLLRLKAHVYKALYATYGSNSKLLEFDSKTGMSK